MARLPNLNELTINTSGGTLTVVGSTASFAPSVIVNGTNSADLNHDGTFAAPNMPLTTNYTAVAEDSHFRYATNTITVNLSTNVAFQYDANANLTNDGLRSFAYDDENQLISVWVTNQWKSVFTYDAKMRRRIRQEFTWNGSSWTQTNAVYYVYDGNLVVQERDVNNLPTTTYTRGKDLIGSLQNAGGIGGLLARTSQQYSDAPLSGHSYYHADGNGNVTMLINSSQAIVAKYLYDAFGNVLSQAGLLADANVYQFSSKEKDLNSGLAYYLYRFYDPNLQRWPNKDPLGEKGFELLLPIPSKFRPFVPPSEVFQGPDLYEFVGNNPESGTDSLGLYGGVYRPNPNPGRPLVNSSCYNNCMNQWLPSWPTSVGVVAGCVAAGLSAPFTIYGGLNVEAYWAAGLWVALNFGSGAGTIVQGAGATIVWGGGIAAAGAAG